MAAVPSLGRATRVEPSRSRGEATRSLYERFQGPIFGFCLNQLGSREEAEDATQSTFLNAHRALEAGTTPDAESAWLFKIAHNVCLSRRRSTFRRRRVETPSDLQTVQDFLAAPQREGSDDLVRLTDALAHMPDNQRRAILLREWQGLSYREIAGELGLSQAAVETLIFRARRSLVQNLEESPEPVAERVALGRARRAFDVGSLAAVLKTALGGSTALKAAATAVAVTGTAVAVSAPLASKSNQAAPLERANAASVALQSAQHVRPAPAALLPGRDRQRTETVRDSADRSATEKQRSSSRPASSAAAPVTEPPAATAPLTEPDQVAPTGGNRDHGQSSPPPEQQPERAPAGPEPTHPGAPVPPKDNPGQGQGESHSPPAQPPGQQKDKDNGGNGKGPEPAPQAGAAGREGPPPGGVDKPEQAKK